MNSAYFSGLMPMRPQSTGLGGFPKNSYLGQMGQANQPAILQQTALPPVAPMMPQPAMTPLPGTTPTPGMIPGRDSFSQSGALPQQPMMNRKPYMQQPYTPIFRQQETM